MGLVSYKEPSGPENRERSSGEGSEYYVSWPHMLTAPLYHTPVLKRQWSWLDPGSRYSYPSICVFPVTKDQGREWQPETGCEGSGAGVRT